ncbi:SNF-related serine/threonine-protein kinase isoform X2 [Bacillus rossius redtenbacheri]
MHRGASRHSYDGKIAGLYDLEQTLGRGHFAVVKLARHVFTGEKVAVKVIDKTKLDEVSRAHLFQEVRCMKLVQHPNVVRLYEVIDTQTKLYLILELGDGGDLYDYIMRHDAGLDENQAREYFRQIVRAISYCHRLHVVHRDLKPENVVFFERLGMVKLTDFGFSNRFNPGQKLETSCGSLAYSAPEILLGDSYDAPAVDVWSLGVILYMLVCGQAPFQEANDSETLTMIMDCKYTIPVHVSDACKRLIARMLIREPEKRATLEQIAADPWLGEDNSQPADFLPLISREHVSEDDHALIIQKMVNGNIASKEEILDALDKNEYNHITATYFLLAERKLRAHRQEQAQQRLRQGLVAPSDISPGKPYLKIENSSMEEENSSPNVNQSLLTVSRTPGEVAQNYRARKCSIVQEEEDEDDMSGCSGREELAPPHGSLNRRGSRSEGKLNLALQERLAESERRKEKAPTRDDTAKTKAGWVKAVPINIKYRPVTAGSNQRAPVGRNTKPRPPTQLPVAKQSVLPVARPPMTTTTTTSIITQSSTISIPVQSGPAKPGTPLLPKYKTMPSPTRPPHALLGTPQLALNEIFEEVDGTPGGDSVGQSPSTRAFISRPQARGGGYEQRCSKFHKARTASCSSSDASDDDSESRKKRAHKLSAAGKSLQQRRDSHDDSSDSQDPGGGTGGGSGGGGGHASNNAVSGGGPTSSTRVAGVSEGSRMSGGGTGGRQCAGVVQNPPLGRRHRTGRRRSGETRLRESQSLNRITEVQEAEHVMVQNVHAHSGAVTSSSAARPSPKIKGFGARLLQSWSLTSGSRKSAVLEEKGNVPAENSPLQVGSLLSRNDREKIKVPTSPATEGPELATVHGRTGGMPSKNAGSGVLSCCAEEKENFCKSGKSKSLRDKHQEGSGKKVRLLGRYFQVHKKLCIPLPGFFGRGRLYKAQSCGSIVRDRVMPPPAASLLLCGDDRWQHMAGKTDVGRGSAGQGNSNDGEDVNRNVGIVATEGIAAANSGIGMCHIHLGNASKCCNFC